MTIRLGRPMPGLEWHYADADEEILFPKQEPRVVKFDVRTEVRSSLFADFGEGTVFLCVVDGMETVELVADGPFQVHGEAPIYLRSAELQYIHSENLDSEIFTKMHERRPIAPEIQEMQRAMHKNLQRMKAEMLRDIEGMRRATERQNARNLEAEAAKVAAGAGEGPDKGSEPPAKAIGGGTESGGEGPEPKAKK